MRDKERDRLGERGEIVVGDEPGDLHLHLRIAAIRDRDDRLADKVGFGDFGDDHRLFGGAFERHGDDLSRLKRLIISIGQDRGGGAQQYDLVVFQDWWVVSI